MTVDFHSHTRESDGALGPTDLVALMRARGVGIFSITDHDTMRAYGQFEAGFATVVPGIEINTTWEDNEVHVLGYAVPLGDEQNYPAGMTHQNRGSGVGVMRIKLLDRARGRVVLDDDAVQLVLQLHQPLGDRLLRVQPDHPGVDELRLHGMKLDHPVTGELQAGIDAEDSH